jgi:hypothetical protein
VDHTARVGSVGEQANLVPPQSVEYSASVVQIVVFLTILTALSRFLHRTK